MACDCPNCVDGRVLDWMSGPQTYREARTLSYKPGWTLRAPNGPGMIGSVSVMAQNTYRPETQTSLCLPVLPRDWERNPAAALLLPILRIEIHEACEWLVVDGKRPFDPHNTLLYNNPQHLEEVMTEAARSILIL